MVQSVLTEVVVLLLCFVALWTTHTHIQVYQLLNVGAGEFDESVSLVQLVNKKKEELWTLFESIVLRNKIIDIILGC